MKLNVFGSAGILLLLAGTLPGCTRSVPMSADAAQSSNSDPLEINESSAGKSISLQTGQRLRITLAETLSTGYQWKLSDVCPTQLEKESDTATAPQVETPGSPGSHAWVFRARHAGRCDLQFQSARPWEKALGGRSVTFAVNVTG